MHASTLFAAFTAIASLALAQPTSNEEPRDLAPRASSSNGYAYLGCMGSTQSAAQVFNNPAAVQTFGNGANLNPSCASFCRGYNTQYYSNIDYTGQCACGNTLNFNLTYTTSSPGCQLCGGNFRDESYVTGPGVCGDYYYGIAALYSLDF